jgi:hypothetical protein
MTTPFERSGLVPDDEGYIEAGYRALAALPRPYGVDVTQLPEFRTAKIMQDCLGALAPAPMVAAYLHWPAVEYGGAREQEMKRLPWPVAGALRATMAIIDGAQGTMRSRLRRSASEVRIAFVARGICNLEDAMMKCGARGPMEEVTRHAVGGRGQLLKETFTVASLLTHELGKARIMAVPALGVVGAEELDLRYMAAVASAEARINGTAFIRRAAGAGFVPGAFATKRPGDGSLH